MNNQKHDAEVSQGRKMIEGKLGKIAEREQVATTSSGLGLGPSRAEEDRIMSWRSQFPDCLMG